MGRAADVVVIVYVVHVNRLIFMPAARHGPSDYEPITVILEARTALDYDGAHHKAMLTAEVRAEMVFRNAMVPPVLNVADVMALAMMFIPVIVVAIFVMPVGMAFTVAVARSAIIIPIAAMVVVIAIVLGHCRHSSADGQCKQQGEA